MMLDGLRIKVLYSKMGSLDEICWIGCVGSAARIFLQSFVNYVDNNLKFHAENEEFG